VRRKEWHYGKNCGRLALHRNKGSNMAKIILVWVLLSVAIGAVVACWRKLAGKEKWKLTKIVAYATLCSLVAMLLLALIVIVF
jgi:hypothetical protein